MVQKNKLLYPLRAGALLSVAIFGILGIAAITGHLPVGVGEANRLFALAGSPIRANDLTMPVNFTGPLHAGLTRRNDDVAPAAGFTLRKGQKISASRCEVCGVIHSIEPGDSATTAAQLPDPSTNARYVRTDHGEAGNYDASSFVITVKMQDGTTRTIHERQRPKFSVGERVRFVNGSILSLG
jgi:hypothetical protein